MINNDLENDDYLEEFVGRHDFTSKSTEIQRRLDGYAILLAAHSMCVSTSIINGKFYISANEFFQGTQSERNQNLLAIRNIHEYFSNILNPDETKRVHLRKKAFLKVCSVARFNLQYKTSFSKMLAENIAQNVYERENSDPQISAINDKYGKDGSTAAMMYARFQRLLNYFSRIEELLLQDRQLLSVFSSCTIIKDSTQYGIHAEMQQLAIVVKFIEGSITCNEEIKQQEIYFGIAKLCCLHCHVTLEAANRVFKEKKIPITLKVRGWHNLDQGAKLLDSTIFNARLGRLRRDKTSDNIGFLIKTRSEQLFKQVIEYRKSKTIKAQAEDSDEAEPDYIVNMDPSDSGSESAETIQRDILAIQTKLKIHLELLTKQEEKGSDLKNIIKNLNISSQLLSITAFTNIPSQQLDDPSLILGAILEELNKDKQGIDQISESEIYNVIKDPLLIGERFSKPFRAYFKQQTMQSTLDTITENRANFQLALQEQQKLLTGLQIKCADYEILTKYSSNSEGTDESKLYQVTQKLFDLTKQFIFLEKTLALLLDDIEQERKYNFSSRQKQNKYVVCNGQRMQGETKQIEGDGWCALRAAGFDNPAAMVEVLARYHKSEEDNKGIKRYIVNLLRESIYNNYQAVFSLEEHNIVLEGLDHDGNSIAVKLDDLFKAVQDQANQSLREDSEKFNRLYTYIETKEVQQSYLNYILKNKYADYNIILACLTVEGRNRQIALLVDYASHDGKLANLSRSDIDLEDPNVKCVVYKPNTNPFLAHYNQFVLQPHLTLTIDESIDQSEQIQDHSQCLELPESSQDFNRDGDKKRSLESSLGDAPKSKKQDTGCSRHRISNKPF